MTLYLKPFDEEGKIYKIFDSKGLTGYEDKDEYQFAVKIGCIENNAELTDQEIAQKLKVASDIMIDLSIDFLRELREQIKVTSWSWKSGYGGSASGQGIVKNSSDFSIPRLKYKITYYDRNDNQITTDDGYVTYDKLGAGSSKSFTFYTSYVGSPIVGKQLSFLDIEGVKNEKKKEPMKIEINKVSDFTNDGAVNINDVESLVLRYKSNIFS